MPGSQRCCCSASPPARMRRAGPAERDRVVGPLDPGPAQLLVDDQPVLGLRRPCPTARASRAPPGRRSARSDGARLRVRRQPVPHGQAARIVVRRQPEVHAAILPHTPVWHAGERHALLGAPRTVGVHLGEPVAGEGDGAELVDGRHQPGEDLVGGGVGGEAGDDAPAAGCPARAASRRGRGCRPPGGGARPSRARRGTIADRRRRRARWRPPTCPSARPGPRRPISPPSTDGGPSSSSVSSTVSGYRFSQPCPAPAISAMRSSTGSHSS